VKQPHSEYCEKLRKNIADNFFEHVLRKSTQKAFECTYVVIFQIFGSRNFFVPLALIFFHKNKMKHICAQVVALKNAGHSQRDTARIIGKPHSFVKRWWNRNDLLDRHAGGNPVKITRSLINEVHRRIKVLLPAGGTGHEHLSNHGAQGCSSRRFASVPSSQEATFVRKTEKRPQAWARSNTHHNWHKVLFTDEKIVYCVPHTNSKNDIVRASKGDIISRLPLSKTQRLWENGRLEIFIFKTKRI